MTIHPKKQKDLLLAPVAVGIDLNLKRVRDGSANADDVLAELELELDRPARVSARSERSELVLRQALRNVDLHGWTANITEDGTRVHLAGGSVTLDLGLGPAVTSYIEHGARGTPVSPATVTGAAVRPSPA